MYANEGDKAQVAASGNLDCTDNAHGRLISLRGSCESEVFQLLNDRSAATMDAYNNPSVDLNGRPIMYSGTVASAGGHFTRPDEELKRAMEKENASSNT